MVSFNTFLESINKDTNKFGFFGNFSSSNRKKLSNDILKIFDFISKSELTEDELENLSKLRLKIIKKLSGGFSSNLFNKIFSKTKIDVKELFDREKKADKLRKAGVHPRHFVKILGKTKKAKRADNLLFKEHLFDRLQYFGHAATFNDKGDITFRVSQDYFLKEVISTKPKKIKWKKLHQEWAKKGAFLEVKGEFKEGCYRTVAIDNLTIKQFKELLIENGALNEKVRVVYPPKYLTLNELIEQDYIDEEGDVADGTKYTADGFRKIPEDWNTIPPFMHASQPPKNFTLEILVHTKGRTPVIMKDGDFGHVSIKLITPNGEIYSFGLYPNHFIEVLDGEGLSLQKGDLDYIDQALFYPSHAFKQQKLRYTLSDEKSFHRLMRSIAGMKGQDHNEASNLFYHFTHHNCTSFAREIRDFVLEHGGKAEYWEEHQVSDWTHIGFRIKYTIFKVLGDVVLKSPLGKLVNWDKGIEEHAGIKNFNIRQFNPKGMALPPDLLFEHLVLQSKTIS